MQANEDFRTQHRYSLHFSKKTMLFKKTTARGFRHHFKVLGQQIIVGKTTVVKQTQTLTEFGISFSLYVIQKLFENETRHNENEFTEGAVA